MDLRHIRYFLAVAEAGTVTRAAELLHVSQPAISRQIRDLEKEIGVVLFERVGRNVRLTGAGEDLLADSRAILRQAETLRNHARALAAGESGVLRVGATPQTLERLFPALLAQAQEILPGVKVRLHEGTTQTFVDDLRAGRIHLAITTYQPEWASSARILGVANLFAVYASAGRREARQIELKELADKSLLLLKRGFGSRDLFDAACHVAHVRPGIFLESSSPGTLLRFAKAGHGTAVIPPSIQVKDRGLAVRAIAHEGKALELPFAVHWNPLRNLPRYAERFVDLLETEVQATQFMR